MKSCILCGWKIPDGKGSDPFPVSREEGAVVCNWCAENIVIKARKAVEAVVQEMSICTVAENAKRIKEKMAMND